ncbi:MAG TPA: aminotransferase class I/II-fold pyridoxal phosphate-dependent enzyme [Herpetosiphonaceae bacterium]
MAQRVQGFGTSIFSEMSALAAQHQAINLSQGFPDFAGPAHVKEAAIAAIMADHNQYAPSPGVPALRQAIAATYGSAYGLDVTAADVTVTCGATEALCAVLLAVVNPGDEVIIFEPAYDAYGPDTIMAGGVPRYVRLEPPQTTDHAEDSDHAPWSFDPAALRSAFGPKTRAIIVNTPHNPTGKVFSRDELELIARLCVEHHVIAIADEVYDRMIYTGQHVPIATLPGMWPRSITINSTGKTFSMTGWKIGYTIAPPPLTEAIRRVHQFSTFAVATPFQHAMAAALDDALRSHYYAELLDFYRQRRNMLVEILRASGFEVASPAGTYFVMAGIRSWGFDSDVAFCRHLTTEVGVAAIPPSAFYAQPETAPLMARFCFAKEIATLQAAAERLQRRTTGVGSAT